jgi:hypothetical protein
LPRFGTISNVTFAIRQTVQAGLLDGRNMDENVLAAAIRRDEAITLLAVNHFTVPLATSLSPRNNDCSSRAAIAALGQQNPPARTGGLASDWHRLPVVQVRIAAAIVMRLRLVALVGPMTAVERAQIADEPLQDLARGNAILLTQVLKFER